LRRSSILYKAAEPGMWRDNLDGPAVVYEGRAELCPSGFFMEVGARPHLNQILENNSVTVQVMESR
jgi:hypothetical protein